MREKITLNCEFCGKEFIRNKCDYTRSKKRKPDCKMFCSKSCVGMAFIDIKIPKERRNGSNLIGLVHIDEYSPFRRHLSNARSHCLRSKGRLQCLLTLDDIKDLWERQGGICPYTGRALINAPSTGASQITCPLTSYRASLDRIDSSKGYTVDNVQFVAYAVNIAKHALSSDEFIDFCKAVANYRG